MDYELKFDAKQRIVLLAFFNDLTEASYLAGFRAGVAFIRANPPEGVIVDFSNIREFGLSSAFVRMIADLPEVLTKPRVVIAPQKVVFGMVRMFQILRESNNAGYPALVESMDEALKLFGWNAFEFTPVPPGSVRAAS